MTAEEQVETRSGRSGYGRDGRCDGRGRLAQPRSLRISGRRTSLRLEAFIWLRLQELADREGVSITDIVERIEASRPTERPLASATRVFVAEYWHELGSRGGV